MKFFTFTSFVVVAACAMADDIAPPETFDSPLIASFFAEHEAPETILSENKEVFKDSMVAALFETPETTLLEKKEDSKAPKKVSQTIHRLAKKPIFDTHKHQLGVIQKKLEAIETSHKGFNGNGGGAEDLASRVSTATTDISNAVKTMQEGLESDHALGKTEIKALYDAIDKTADITPAEKEAVKQKAKTWCEKKQDYDNKKGTYDNAVSDRNGKDGSADTGLNTLKEIFGDTSVTSCSKASYPNTQCPDQAQCTDQDKFTVVATLVTKLNDARKAYRLAQIAEADAKGPMDDAEAANTQAKDAFKQMITDYVQSKFDECGGSKSTLYTTAKSAFSEQNTQRAKMYHALGQVQCYIQHIDNHDSTSKALTAQSVPKTSGASATSAADCVSAMKTAAEIKAEKFTEYTNSGSVSGCKTKAELEKQISDYGNLQLTKDVWAPITSTCDAVNAHTTAQGWTFVGTGQCQTSAGAHHGGFLPDIFFAYHDGPPPYHTDECKALCEGQKSNGCIGITVGGPDNNCVLELNSKSAESIVKNDPKITTFAANRNPDNHKHLRINGGTWSNNAYSMTNSGNQACNTNCAIEKAYASWWPNSKCYKMT
jgi:hypothetical protein